MNNDLISRKQVMELIESKFVDGCLEQGDKTLIDGYGLLDEVFDIPTAYDMDKVLERLEEKTELAYKRYIDCDSSTPSPVYIRYATQYKERRECLEIVKAGGLNEN